jgi:hypothetical protein
MNHTDRAVRARTTAAWAQHYADLHSTAPERREEAREADRRRFRNLALIDVLTSRTT